MQWTLFICACLIVILSDIYIAAQEIPVADAHAGQESSVTDSQQPALQRGLIAKVFRVKVLVVRTAIGLVPDFVHLFRAIVGHTLQAAHAYVSAASAIVSAIVEIIEALEGEA